MRGATRLDKQNEIPALDGVRGIAILLVIWLHFGITVSALPAIQTPALLQWTAAYGFVGLHLFFVLSGFLIFRPYARALVEKRPWPNPWRFYQRRARRILPAYYVVITPLLLVVIGKAHDLLTALQLLTVLYGSTLSSWQLISWYDGPLWSLALEWQFYALLPWLAQLFRRFQQTVRWQLGVTIGFIAMGLLVRAGAAYLHYFLHWPDPVIPFLYGVKGTYLEEFGLGMLLSVLALRVDLGRYAFWSLPIALLGLIGCAYWSFLAGRIPYSVPISMHWIWPTGPMYAILGEWTITLCCALLVVSALGGTWHWLWTNRWLRWIGTISYSVYLWHVLVLMFLPTLVTHAPWAAHYLVSLGLTCGLSFAIGALSYRFCERPFLAGTSPRLSLKPRFRWIMTTEK